MPWSNRRFPSSDRSQGFVAASRDRRRRLSPFVNGVRKTRERIERIHAKSGKIRARIDARVKKDSSRQAADASSREIISPLNCMPLMIVVLPAPGSPNNSIIRCFGLWADPLRNNLKANLPAHSGYVSMSEFAARKIMANAYHWQSLPPRESTAPKPSATSCRAERLFARYCHY